MLRFSSANTHHQGEKPIATADSDEEQARIISMSKGMTILAANQKRMPRKTGPAPSIDPASEAVGLGESPIGDALRSIYQQTIEEEIPQEFLDILGKLA